MALIDYWWILLLIALSAFLIKLLDTILGLGFGTVITPILLILGVSTSITVPSVLFAEMISGLIGMLFHLLFRNIRLGQKRVFKRKRKRRSQVYDYPNSKPYKIEEKEDNSVEFVDEENEEEEIIEEDDDKLTHDIDDEVEEIRLDNQTIIQQFRNLTTDTKIIIILSSFGIIGAIISAIINVIFDANDIFNLVVMLYIGLMVLAMGIIVLVYKNKSIKYSLKRIIFLGLFGGFNKGISGGGYTPITVMGQLLVGRRGKNALASTTYAKTAVSVVGIISYVLTHIIVNTNAGLSITWEYLGLTPYLMIGAVIAAPIGALIAKKVKGRWWKITIGSTTIFLGLFTLIRTIFDFANIWEIKPIIDMTNILMSI